MGIGLVFIFLLSIISVTMIDAHAISRIDIKNMDDKIEDLREDTIQLTRDIITQKRLITALEFELENLEDREKIQKDFDRFVNTGDSRKALNDLSDDVRDKQKELNQGIIDLQTLIDRKLAAQNTILSHSETRDDNIEILKGEHRIQLEGLTRMIGVDLSNTCRIMLSNNFTTNCPSFEDMIGLDNSKYQSGEFSMIDGLYQRGEPLLLNDHRLYDFDEDWGIIIDPSGNLKSRIKMITIENNLNDYLTVDDRTKQNHTRSIHHDRYVDNCNNATIDGSNWRFTLPDTIHYLRTDCTVTGLSTMTVIEDYITDIDITTSPNWQYQQWLNESKKKCVSLCFEY